MAANTGRTHSKWCQVWLDNAAGELTNITAYVNTISQFGTTYDTQDVSAFSNAVKNVVIGQPGAPITLGGPIDTTIITHMIAINGLEGGLTLDIKLGIRQAWDAEPQFGITSDAGVSGYLCSAFNIDPNANTWSASFDVFGPTAPAFGAEAET